MHGPLDVITPDELTVGRGSTEMGGYLDEPQGVHDFDYSGDSETTYVALTWDIPSFREEGLTTDERRAIRDFYAQADSAPAEEEDGMFTLRDGAKPPPAWLPFALAGIGLAIVLGFALRSRRQDQW
tara:strand:+ start:293 stop:670 length:378 start_codon:yes stop_codon:yes gene_type:complete